MKEIELTLGKKALVDDADYEWLSQYSWSACKGKYTIYALRSGKNKAGKFINIAMHREIMQTPDGLLTDHIDGNGLNNQRTNLRICSAGQNQHNSSPHKNRSSKFKGVSWKKSGKKWVVRIQLNYKSKHIGVYKTEIEASNAFQDMLLKNPSATA